jgi:hypothetical protein
MDERGHAAAVFKQWRDGESSVWLSRHDLAAGWGPARRLAWGTAEGSLEYPQVGLDANGTAHVVWRRFGASTSSICGLRLQ